MLGITALPLAFPPLAPPAPLLFPALPVPPPQPHCDPSGPPTTQAQGQPWMRRAPVTQPLLSPQTFRCDLRLSRPRFSRPWALSLHSRAKTESVGFCSHLLVWAPGTRVIPGQQPHHQARAWRGVWDRDEKGLLNYSTSEMCVLDPSWALLSTLPLATAKICKETSVTQRVQGILIYVFA